MSEIHRFLLRAAVHIVARRGHSTSRERFSVAMTELLKLVKSRSVDTLDVARAPGS